MKKKIITLLLVVCSLITILAANVQAGRYTQDPYCPAPYDLHWSGKTAKWSVDGWASKYQVTLYRDGSKVKTKNVTSRSCSFADQMSRGGEYDYFFRVRAYNKDNSYWSDWEESDIITVRSSTGSSGSSSTGPATVVPGYAPGQASTISTNSGKWVKGSDGFWRYRFNNGSYAQYTWLNVNGKWYYINNLGVMATGFVNDGGHTYFLNPNGEMVTGTVVLGGVTHFFDSNGVMVY